MHKFRHKKCASRSGQEIEVYTPYQAKLRKRGLGPLGRGDKLGEGEGTCVANKRVVLHAGRVLPGMSHPRE